MAGSLALLLLLMALLSGCGDEIPFIGGSGDEEKKTVISSDIYIPIERLQTGNPLTSRDEDTYFISKLVYDGLFELDENLAAVPALVQSYSYDSSGTVLTLELKNGVQWHDGKTLTADDVEFTVETLMSLQSSGLSLYDQYVKNIRSVRAKGDQTVTITFRSETDASVANLTFPIVPKHQFKKTSDAKKVDENFFPVGTGPYKVESLTPINGVVLTGNPSYHGGAAPTNILHFDVIPDKMDAINLFDINEYSIVFSKEIDRKTLITNKEVNTNSFYSNEVEFLGFNFNKAAMAEQKVRQAISMGLDEKGVIETAYYNSGIRNDNIYYPNFLGVDSQSDLSDPDPTAAKALLAEAGYVDRDGDGVLESEAGDELSIRILFNVENESRATAAQVIKQSLDRLQIRTELDGREWSAYNSALASGSFDLYIGGYQIRDNYDLRFLLKSRLNPIGYSNPELDELLDRMESGITASERKETFEKIKEILVEDQPYNCLLYKTYGAISSKALKGSIEPYFFDLYHNCITWTSEIPAP